MRSRILLLSLSLCLLPMQASFAEALALAAPANSCLSASVDAQQPRDGADIAYRIVFRNWCATQRSFFWCAEYPAGAAQGRAACPRAQSEGARSVAAEPRYVIQVRKEFISHLPAGTRIRFQDCPPGEFPTVELGCAAAPLR